MPFGRSRRVRRRRVAAVAGGAYAVHRHRQNEAADQEAEAGYSEQEPVGGEAAPQENGGSDAEQLTQLKTLLDEGALTQDEYDAEKQKILSA